MGVESSIPWRERVAFDPIRAAKADVWRGDRLFVGLNCLLTGQSQAPHEHADADKVYLVVQGTGRFEVGGDVFIAASGELVPASAGVRHGVSNEGSEPLVVLTIIAPPPSSP